MEVDNKIVFNKAIILIGLIITQIKYVFSPSYSETAVYYHPLPYAPISSNHS